jgi:hypothetical protein
VIEKRIFVVRDRQVNIEIMRVFVELRRAAGSFQELRSRLDQMELAIGARLGEHDEQLRQIFEALRQLIAPPLSTKAPHRLQGSRGRRVTGMPISLNLRLRREALPRGFMCQRPRVEGGKL